MPESVRDDARPLNLEQQKNLARELQRDLASGASDAVRRFRVSHPGAAACTQAHIIERFSKLSDAQLVIARELGLASWPKLKHHIDRLAAARAAITSGATPPDESPRTLHIRCGSDILGGLRAAGFSGSLLEFSDPYCQGPVTGDDGFIDRRARFLASSYGISLDDARATLESQHEGLRASRHVPRVVLWFEHDSFDQLILARILAFYAEHGCPPRLDLVCIDRFPAIKQFNGLGQLSPTALRMLWDDRRLVSSAQLALGARVWNSLGEATPIPLYHVTGGVLPLTQMGPALVRHLQELPWVGDGLSLTQRLTLEALSTGPLTGGQLFRRLCSGLEPLVFLGDTMYWAILSDMTNAGRTPFTVDDSAARSKWSERRLDLSQTGRDILEGRLDWLECHPPERWVGGVRIASGSPHWRWDSERREPRLISSERYERSS